MADPADSEDSTPPSSEAGSCRLFTMPGELRNRIYRYVLLDPDNFNSKGRIPVNASGYSRPGLLSVSKEIRSEALKIYYHENAFEIMVDDCNSDPLLEWMEHLESMDLGKSPKFTICPDTHLVQPEWPNLLKWLERIHQGKVPKCRYRQPGFMPHATDVLSALVQGMFAVVDEMREQPWDLVEKVLRHLRPGLSQMDDRWKKD